MPHSREINSWVETLRSRYVSYLTTSFYFRDPKLRRSFRDSLGGEELRKGPFRELGRRFPQGINARKLAQEAFPAGAEPLFPALLDAPLHVHQEQAIRTAHMKDENVVVASGTASGKTECFLYPVLFSLFREHLAGTLTRPGVRAMVLYPMNALVNDQRERLGGLCRDLEDGGSNFRFTFGQYIGQTPYSARDRYRNGAERGRSALPGEMVFREDMWQTPPHILFTNYSMLEYLLIRPQDSPLFDDGRGELWRFLILDEAHAYRGAKGIEMAMLLRRVKERLYRGGRRHPFRCIATSATIASGHSEDDQRAVAQFAVSLFGEPFQHRGVVFGQHEKPQSEAERRLDVRRHHVFFRALEGAFLLYDQGEDRVVLNRASGNGQGGSEPVPLEIALCRECGQHYYVGKEANGRLVEAVRDPSRPDFGVDFYAPVPRETARLSLCRHCGALGRGVPGCGCGAEIGVEKCPNRPNQPDQMRECARCGYTRGGIGDPVQEIVHGADGPNAVLATAVHGLLPPDARKILAFADSRQDAAFFAWYAEESYTTLRDRNLMLRALRMQGTTRIPRADAGLSIADLGHRLAGLRQRCGVDAPSDTAETTLRRAHEMAYAEAVTEDSRLSLSGVGLAHWSVQLPAGLTPPQEMLCPPWDLTPHEATDVLQILLSLFWSNGAIALPDGPEFPTWKEVSRRPPYAFVGTAPRGRKNVREWGGPQSGAVRHLLPRFLRDREYSGDDKHSAAQELMKTIWRVLMAHHEQSPEGQRLLERTGRGGAFRLRGEWLRVRTLEPSELWECRICARVTAYNVQGVCVRNRCPGTLGVADSERLRQNHYRLLYEVRDLPPTMTAAEHTAQLADDEARTRQAEFKGGSVNLLSSSTTFEVGVDLGDLEVTFLRNVPPEPFNYAQRVGRAGRRQRPGLALTYCRRSPHDLHYFSKHDTLIDGKVVPPRLVVRNPTIVTRHMTAVALSEFFRDQENRHRFQSVAAFMGGDWSAPSAAYSLKRYCTGNQALTNALLRIVPSDLHDALGLRNGTWADGVAGPGSRLAKASLDICDEYVKTKNIRDQCVRDEKFWEAGRATQRMRTIADEDSVQFLARKAVIPKYGFPVDVVELHTGIAKAGESVELSRDLALAIAEYAPDSRVVANKLEWKSCGVRRVVGKEPRVRAYEYDDRGSFRCEPVVQGTAPSKLGKKYIVPEFGFVTPLWHKPKPPERRSERLFSTRPFFKGFAKPGTSVEERRLFGIGVTPAVPGELVVLCEGRKGNAFLLCDVCGKSPEIARKNSERQHQNPEGRPCEGILRRFALGHELTTDVVKVCFPQPLNQWERYSLGYALLLGAADAVAVPERDLNVTLAPDAVVLYDDVPGGAGLVAQLTNERSFRRVLERAGDRVSGECGCDRSCYGCLRSYRNQFAHPHLDRLVATKVLDGALATH